jgi:large subunit ribosomal protein L5
MKNIEKKYKHNHTIPFKHIINVCANQIMESLPVVEELKSAHRHSRVKLKTLETTLLEKQTGRSDCTSSSATLGSIESERLNAPGIERSFFQQTTDSPESMRNQLSEESGDATAGKGWKVQVHCTPRTERFYREVLCFDLLLQCQLRGIMELSLPKKIVLNSSSKKIVHDKKELIIGLSACLMISGQRCQATWARKSISGFKLREGSVLGCKVTLRGNLMYTFVDKLINLVLPRARPSLISQAIDANGPYNIGISDPFLFVELEHHYDLFQSLEGVDIALVMSSREKAFAPLFWSGLQLFAE